MTTTREVTECIDVCTSTAGVLDACAAACRAMGDMEECEQVCVECAAVCELYAEGLEKGDHSWAADCIASCETCALECKSHPEMPACVRSAKACRECIMACKQAEKVSA